VLRYVPPMNTDRVFSGWDKLSLFGDRNDANLRRWVQLVPTSQSSGTEDSLGFKNDRVFETDR
jgi:hypothetical protein